MLNELERRVRLRSLLGVVILTPLLLMLSTPVVLFGAGVAYLAVIATIPKWITERQIRRYIVPAIGIAAILSGLLMYSFLSVTLIFPLVYVLVGAAVVVYGRFQSHDYET